MMPINKHKSTKSFYLTDFNDGKVSLKFVLACYEMENGSTFFEMAQANNGILTSFVALDMQSVSELVKKMGRLLQMSGDNKINFKSDEPYPKDVLWITTFGTIVFKDNAKKETLMSYAGKTIKLNNLPELVYVVSENKIAVFEEIIGKKGEKMYIPANLPNVSNHDGHVCMGNTLLKIKGLSVHESINLSLSTFWSSTFTGHSDSTKNDWRKGVYNYRQREDVQPKTLKEVVKSC